MLKFSRKYAFKISLRSSFVIPKFGFFHLNAKNNENGFKNYKFDFHFSQIKASKKKIAEKQYEETEKDLNEIISIFASSDEESLDIKINEKEEENWEVLENVDKNEICMFTYEADPKLAALNLQTFIMKASEKLSSGNLGDFLNLTENFKRLIFKNKINLYNFHSNTRTYFKLARKIFQKDDAASLVQLLMVCDVNRISYENFGSTIFNYESELEVQSKISQFHSFSQEHIPLSKPLVTDLEKKYKKSVDAPNENKHQTDIFSQISKINFEIERNEEENVSDDKSKYFERYGTNKKDLSDANSSEDISEIMLDKLIFDEIKEEIETNFTISSLKYAKEIHENLLETQSTSSKYAELEKKFNLENFFIEKTEKKWSQEKNLQASNTVKQLQLQQPKEILILHQENFSTKNIEKTNWVYVRGLPYTIAGNEIALWENELREKFQRFAGKVVKIKIFPYSEFLSLKEQSKNIYSLNPSQLSNNEEFWDFLKNETTSKNKEQAPKITNITNAEIKFEPEKTKKKMKKTEKILAKIKEKSSKKLDKSYALIEFENYESKQKALLTELRVFGLQISGNMCFTDDADYKLTLMCNNVHWGASLEKFCDFLNEKLKEAKHSDLKIEIQPKDYKKIITKYYLIIRFNNFSNTLKAMRALRNTVFEDRVLRFGHLYGSLKQNKSNFSEMLNITEASDTVERLQDNRRIEISKINNETGENAAEITDLLLEEGLLGNEESEEEYPPLFMHEHPSEEDIEEKYKRFLKKYSEQEELERLERERFEYRK